MSVQVNPVRDRRGRVYTPAVGPRLRPLLWTILIGFAVLGANGFYLASVTARDLVSRHNAADFFLHAHGRPAPVAGLPGDRPVPDLRFASTW